jgi:UDP-2-acetamido-3-amino-2,3-dideoxy-glucuronate N-acetyltransferase
MVSGVPARIVGWMSAFGDPLRFDEHECAVDSVGARYRRTAPASVIRES